MKDSEQTKESRYDCRLIQNRDDECNIVKPFAFSEHWPPVYASTGSPTELDAARKPSLFRLSTGNNRAMRPRWKFERERAGGLAPAEILAYSIRVHPTIRQCRIISYAR